MRGHIGVRVEGEGTSHSLVLIKLKLVGAQPSSSYHFSGILDCPSHACVTQLLSSNIKPKQKLKEGQTQYIETHGDPPIQ